jgi:hypothetical protein
MNKQQLLQSLGIKVPLNAVGFRTEHNKLLFELIRKDASPEGAINIKSFDLSESQKRSLKENDCLGSWGQDLRSEVVPIARPAPIEPPTLQSPPNNEQEVANMPDQMPLAGIPAVMNRTQVHPEILKYLRVAEALLSTDASFDRADREYLAGLTRKAIARATGK